AQQFRMGASGDQPHRWIIHDRDRIYSDGVDATVAAMGLTILKTPVRAPQANAFCERLIGTIRRECLDWVIPLNERHVRRVLAEWVAHYNHGRPHASLGPGIPDPQGEAPRERAGRVSEPGAAPAEARHLDASRAFRTPRYRALYQRWLDDPRNTLWMAGSWRTPLTASTDGLSASSSRDSTSISH